MTIIKIVNKLKFPQNIYFNMKIRLEILTVWLIPHIKTLKNGSLALNNLTF